MLDFFVHVKEGNRNDVYIHLHDLPSRQHNSHVWVTCELEEPVMRANAKDLGRMPRVFSTHLGKIIATKQRNKLVG